MSILFIRIGGVIIGFAALIKIISVWAGGALQYQQDQLLGLQFRTIMITSAIIEVAVAAICLVRSKGWLAPLLIVSLTAQFLLYRVSSKMLGVQKMCPCLGYFTQWLGLNQQSTDWLLGGFSLIFFVGGSWILLQTTRNEG